MPRKKEKDENSINWYKVMPKHFLEDIDNPCYEQTGISLPARIIIVGASGSKKTVTVLNLIHKMKNTFSHIILCCMNAQEPLYKFLASKLDNEDLTICEGEENIVGFDDIEGGKDNHTLVIYDDLCLAKNQDKISQMFIRGRKKPASIIYCTQSFYKTPKVCRVNATHIILRKLSTMRDLKMILSDFELDVSREELLKMYNECTKDGDSFLMIDVATNDPNMRFRKNFKTPIGTST